MRVGIGYDAHRLVRERKLVLGGVEIPFEKGLEGHSDADVLCHAIGDALLGAAGLGDLGAFFPDSDPRWAGVSSLTILREIEKLLWLHHYRIEYIDSVVIAQQPKLAGYFPQMRQRIAWALSIKDHQISIKATTTEGMGFEGRGEGMAAYAVVLLKKK